MGHINRRWYPHGKEKDGDDFERAELRPLLPEDLTEVECLRFKVKGRLDFQPFHRQSWSSVIESSGGARSVGGTPEQGSRSAGPVAVLT